MKCYAHGSDVNVSYISLNVETCPICLELQSLRDAVKDADRRVQGLVNAMSKQSIALATPKWNTWQTFTGFVAKISRTGDETCGKEAPLDIVAALLTLAEAFKEGTTVNIDPT